jgi:hypothetical protein
MGKLPKDQSCLADSAAWPIVKLGSRQVVKHSYENAITAAARLHSFATGNFSISGGPIQDRQELLATDDMLSLAFHSRRLIDNTMSLKRASQVLVQATVKPGLDYIPITRIINVLIHHKEIVSIRSEFDFDRYFGKSIFDRWLNGIEDRKINPICIVTSDKDALIGFRIKEFIEVYHKKIIEPIIDLCDENNLFLTDDIS